MAGKTVLPSPPSTRAALEPYCSEFLYTHSTTEVLMRGHRHGAILPPRATGPVTAAGAHHVGRIDLLTKPGRLDRRMAIYTELGLTVGSGWGLGPWISKTEFSSACNPRTPTMPPSPYAQSPRPPSITFNSVPYFAK